jgi:hypothetical protein
MGKKGTRLPDDWKLPAEWRAYALKIGLSNKDIDLEEHKFKNYWLSMTNNATKWNWERVWKDWCIRIIYGGQL